MTPVTINITNLIGTMVIIGDKENTSAQIQENVADALLKVLARAQNLDNQELSPDKTSLESKDSENQG
jgi:hypothetical protein